MSALAIFAPRRFVRLLAGDASNVGRDPMLLLAVVLSVVPAIAFPFAQPAMDAAAGAAFGVPQLSRYAAAVVLVLPAFLIGWVTGFLLLEDRDEGTLLALDVTPPGKGGFLAYRVAVTATIALLLTLGAWPLVVPTLYWPLALAIAVLVAANAVMAATVLPALARNKVEGLALTKLTNLLGVAPLLAAIPSPLRYVGGVLPSFWIGELLDLSGAPILPPWLVLAMALALHALGVFALFRLLARRAG